MKQNWDYAKLSKAAKEAGGPKKYVDLLESASKKAGKMEMLPWIGIAAIGSSLLTVTTIKVANYIKSKKTATQNEIELAKEDLLSSTKGSDTTHTKEEKNSEAFC